MATLKKSLSTAKAAHLAPSGVKQIAVANDRKVMAAVVKTIADRYGIQVAAAPRPKRNPYTMTTAQATEIAKRAGIITRSGKLAPLFK